MKKYRLMLITHDLALGGLQQVVIAICRTINRDLFDVAVLCLREKGEFSGEIEKLGIPVFLLPQKPSGVDYFAFFKVARLLRKQHIDIVHTHNTQPMIDGVIGSLLAGVRTIIHTDHARSFPDKKKYMFAEWFLSHFVYRVVGVSEHTAQNLHHYEKIPLRKISVIYNGIDRAIRNIPMNVPQKRKELGIVNSGPVIGLGVRLSQQKGITFLLDAMPQIVEHFPEITLVIAGSGHLEKELKEKTVSLNLHRNVLFTGLRTDMQEVLRLFDCYVLPSLWEGLPMVLLEAIAIGCPVVATDVGGNRSIIQTGKNGILVKPGDSTALANAVIAILNNPEKKKKYAENGMRLFDEKFEASVMTKAYEQLYLRQKDEGRG